MPYMCVGYSGYECRRCPKCRELMRNGRCENLDCEYHLHPMEDDDENADEKKKEGDDDEP